MNKKLYDKTAEAIWPDAMDWLVSKHKRDIENLYVGLFDDYLYERFGRLTPDVRKVMLKALMKNIIN